MALTGQHEIESAAGEIKDILKKDLGNAPGAAAQFKVLIIGIDLIAGLLINISKIAGNAKSG